MGTDRIYRQRRKGARMLETSCAEIAQELGLEVLHLDWSEDPITNGREKRTLTVQVRSESLQAVTTEIPIAPEDLEDYPGRAGTEKIDRRIREHLRQLVD